MVYTHWSVVSLLVMKGWARKEYFITGVSGSEESLRTPEGVIFITCPGVTYEGMYSSISILPRKLKEVVSSSFFLQDTRERAQNASTAIIVLLKFISLY